MDVLSPSRRALFACALVAALLSGAGSAAAAGSAPESSPRVPNRPPEFGGEAARDGRTQLIHLRSGDHLDFPIAVRDPNGDPVTIRVGTLPPFVTHDARTEVLIFRPRAEHVGDHSIELDASDGVALARRSLRITVTTNQAPRATLGRTVYGVARDGNSYTIALFEDGDGGNPKVVSQRIPQGSRVVVRGSNVYLEWRPTEADLGAHPIHVEIADGELSAVLSTELTIVPAWMAKKWSSGLLPIIGPTAFVTRDRDLYAGGRFDLAFLAIRHATKSETCTRSGYESECHASQLRLYAGFEVLDAPRAERPALFTYALGYTGSFSQTPRRALLPFFSIEVGGLYQSGVGHRVQTRPELGMFLWSDESVWLDATAGLRLVPAELSTLSGATFALRAQLNPW